MRAKAAGRAPDAEPAAEPTQVISAPTVADDATTAMPIMSAEETRAIPISRPAEPDSDMATEQLNARGKQSGGVSAQELLRREGRL